MAVKDIQTIKKDIRNKQIAPLYFLYGDEAFFIDEISNFIESTVLTEDEKGFNQMVLYGKDTTIEDIISNAKRFPMMADYQVIIVKEAQALSRSIENLISYVKQSQPTTILVMCYKYKKLDKRKALYKSLISNTAVVFESKPLYDYQMIPWISKVLTEKGYNIAPRAAQLLAEYLGNDLSKVINELNKLQIVLPKGTTITPDHIEQNIGISKDYNVFELQKAIGQKDTLKAFRIINYFSQNPKNNPIQLTTGMLFSYFSKLLKIHALPNISEASISSNLKIHKFFAKNYVIACKNYSMKHSSRAITLIKDMDIKSKGVGANGVPSGDLLKEFLVKVINF